MSGVRFLEWDSAFFGRRIARIESKSPSPEAWAAAVEWCRRERIDCAYYLADFSNAEAMARAEATGFRLVDLRVTLGRRMEAAPEVATGVRPACADDLPVLAALAETAFNQTRFSRDPRLAAQAGRLYRTWIQRNAEGLADRVLVAGDAPPAGFLSCHRRGAGCAELGLTAVDAGSRGAGVGSRLVRGFLEWCGANGLGEAFVVTNGANIAAVRLYERAGFRLQAVEAWYHGWMDECP